MSLRRQYCGIATLALAVTFSRSAIAAEPDNRTPGDSIGSAARAKADYPIQPVPFTQVRIADEFWARRLETNRKVTIPYAFKMCEETGRIDNFAVAGQAEGGEVPRHLLQRLGRLQGDRRGRLRPGDPARSGTRQVPRRPDRQDRRRPGAGRLPLHRPHALRTRLHAARREGAVVRPGQRARAVLRRAHVRGRRRPLSRHRQTHRSSTWRSRTPTWCAASSAATRRPIPTATRRSRSAWSSSTASPATRSTCDMAKFFLDSRGHAWGRKLYGDYCQDHKPVVEQTEAVGHAVRAGYMYSGMADVAALTGDAEYIHAIDRIWENVVGQQALPHRRRRRPRRDRRLRPRLRTAQRQRLLRDLRGDRHRPLEPPHVPPERRCKVPRRGGASDLQRLPVRRLAGGEPLLLSQSAGGPKRPGPLAVVRLRVLPVERGPLRPLDPGLRLRPPRRRALRQPLHRR